MLSLIEVKCPHCGVQGQIMLPPLGAIIVGPCPECQGMVTIFCGRVLPLARDIMLQGAPQEKRDHLFSVLSGFLEDRIDRLFTRPDDEVESPDGLLAEDLLEQFENEPGEMVRLSASSYGAGGEMPISQEELDVFTNVDLKLIDNQEYFRAVFE